MSQPIYYTEDEAQKESYKGFSEKLNQTLIESVPDEVVRETQNDTLVKTKYKAPKKENPVTSKLEFAPLARNLQIGSIYTLFICGFTSVVMTPSDPIWASYIPGGYCILLSFILYVWCFFSEFNKQDKVTVEDILNPKQWPEHVCTFLSILYRNETQCVFCFL
ncbi:predicted protein [Naegleria gruberi]|uniref:Predicted protein n=1 Tax=Naegleria gruberi TaxID=5762 RepID=D2UZ83_NAEGR|nr:uncharacterized protein NAEGRDRAFT_61844 [Naegleria gruberi]EFC50107.1 predicted protein [Naegleria gruberi]|eukprot:XP_002682851.1 predicted protein [Naegleria gruberi strain NEG-M]